VPKKVFKPAKDVINQWPEVFEDLYMNTMPVDYLQCVVIEFEDGRVWEIDITDHLNDHDNKPLAERLTKTIKEYQNEIKKIDFKIDIEKLKHDVESSTNKFFK
jgi:hypothetical protein